MGAPFDYFQHRRDCEFKRRERAAKIDGLVHYKTPLSDNEREIIDQPIQTLVEDVHGEIMLSSAEKWLTDDSINLKGPLAGIPVSLKDSMVVSGYDTTMGHSSFVGNKGVEDGPAVRLLKDAGAVPYVKTNLPITLLSFESTNDVWGRSTNPHNDKYSPGGSTGGEAALLAMGGRIGVGSDVAGSVRLPAHWSGCYALRCATGRWPKTGSMTSTAGQEGVPSVFSPMTRTLNDLTYFTRAVIGMQPWKYDYAAHPIPWREDIFQDYKQRKRLRVGVLRTDGVVDPSPACMRSLEMVEAALENEGHEIVEISPPSPFEALRVASLALLEDGGQTFYSFFRTGEWNDRGAAQMKYLMDLAWPLRSLYYLWVKYVRRDSMWADLIADWRPQSAYEAWGLSRRREAIRKEWFDWWEKADTDVIIAPPNATPAIPHGGMEHAVSSCGYTFLFNLLDYTAGVLPVTHVDKDIDKLPAGFNINKLNGIAQGAYRFYDAAAMHGLPVGIQIVGRRLEEEKVLAIMERVEMALGDDRYELLSID